MNVSGQDIAGGMIYLGSRARSAGGHSVEPALIDLSLPVDWHNPNLNGLGMTYWPSYDAISPSSRAAYLLWLASERNDPTAYIGYVFLYFYGLERRAIADLTLSPAHPELGLIVIEVGRLLNVYGSSGSFRTYASGLLDLLHAAMGTIPTTAPDPASLSSADRVPFGIRAALGQYVADGQPIPSQWALAWVRVTPMIALGTAGVRCSSEFNELFCRKYEHMHGRGILVRAPKRRLSASYRPASAGFQTMINAQTPNLPDITELTGPINKLQAIAAATTDALDAYSRYLGRNPDGAKDAAALGLLPVELLESHGGESVALLRTWTGTLLANKSSSMCGMREIIDRWSPGRIEKLSKGDATSLSSLLGSLGVGIEPDVRFGGSTPALDSDVALFQLPAGSPSAPSAAYTAASLIVHLAGMVTAADGSINPDESRHLAEHVERVLRLDTPERVRLETRLFWIEQTRPGLAGLKRRIEPLDASQRAGIGKLMIDVAASDGQITGDEISTLEKIFKLLGLDEKSVYTAVHNFGSIEPGLVTVTSAGEPDARWAIPATRAASEGVLLDPAIIQAKLADTAKVTALLSDIFAEPDTDVTISAATAPTLKAAEEPGTLIAGLDGLHSRMARKLMESAQWSRAEAEDAARGLGIALIGPALDRINEAAIEVCGEPLLDGEDPLIVNDYAREELS